LAKKTGKIGNLFSVTKSTVTCHFYYELKNVIGVYGIDDIVTTDNVLQHSPVSG